MNNLPEDGVRLIWDEDNATPVTTRVSCSNPACGVVFAVTPDDAEWHQSLPLCERCLALLVRLENGE